MDKYSIICPLGEGSFGRVYKAKQLTDSTFVAVKVISKRGRSAKELKDLRGECKVQKHLHHPNIIQMLDSFETENEIVVITEFAHKGLNTILDKQGYLSEERVQAIVWDLVSALYYLHSHRVLHRDLKPQNILLDSKNQAKLCDFGFARNMSTGTHVLTSIKGTPLYMAPELVEEQPYDHTADLWSLGCIIYELLVGAPPFCTPSILQLIRLIRHEQIQWPTFISDNCVSFLKGLLQKNPSKRFTWDEILKHSFVKDHVLISEDEGTMPLTKTLSANTLQVKEQQRKDHAANKNNQSPVIKSTSPKVVDEPKKLTSNSSKSTKLYLNSSNELKDIKNNNFCLNNKMKNISLEKKSIEKSQNSEKKLKFDVKTKLNFIEEKHPIETDEWIVFLKKSIAEVINNEMTSLIQPHLTNIIVSPLRNSNSSPKVLCYVTKLFCLPFVVDGVRDEVLEKIKKVYLEVKLIPNLVYSMKLLLRIKYNDLKMNNLSSTNLLQSSVNNYKNLNDLTVDDLNSLENIFMLITHLVHLENEFLSQLCDAIVILNVFNLFQFILQFGKIKLQIVNDLIAILTHILRIFPENSEIIEKIITTKSSSNNKRINFVDFLRHSNATLREKTCLFLLFLGKLLPKTLESICNEHIQETLEALMYDSIESVRNAAEGTVEELKSKDFYKKNL